jgi:diguanylate cyclase (GGDEF)-like protein
VHSFVEAGEKKEKEIYDHIASGLAKDYDAVYYIRIDTGEFREFAKSQRYEAMNVPVVGKDFYSETEVNVDKFVHPDDREFAKSIHKKDAMLKSLEGRKSFSYKYRLMIDGQSRFFLFTLMRAYDNKHFVLYEKDIEDEIVAENIRKETQKSYATFTQIAESLASNYDILYYVNIENSNYISYECKNIYGRLDMKYSGEDFFGDSILDSKKIVYKADRDMVLGYIDKDYIISSLSERKMTSIDYRIVAPDSVHYVRMTTHKTNDGIHYIIGIVNIDDEVKRERELLKALTNEKELARRDELTGVKNKTAYKELEKSVQENIDKGLDYLPFGLVVCDANNLKRINDTEGHNVGDEYIKQSAKVLCDIFAHSPVFRIGGDEFTVFLRGDDYTNRAELMKKLRSKILDNVKTGSGPVLASGMSEYIPASDNLISDVFERADREMYEDKKRLKE